MLASSGVSGIIEHMQERPFDHFLFKKGFLNLDTSDIWSWTIPTGLSCAQ